MAEWNTWDVVEPTLPTGWAEESRQSFMTENEAEDHINALIFTYGAEIDSADGVPASSQPGIRKRVVRFVSDLAELVVLIILYVIS